MNRSTLVTSIGCGGALGGLSGAGAATQVEVRGYERQLCGSHEFIDDPGE